MYGVHATPHGVKPPPVLYPPNEPPVQRVKKPLEPLEKLGVKARKQPWVERAVFRRVHQLANKMAPVPRKHSHRLHNKVIQLPNVVRRHIEPVPARQPMPLFVKKTVLTQGKPPNSQPLRRVSIRKL